MSRLLAFVLFMASSSAFCMEYTNGFALQTIDGEHVGAVLAAPSLKGESGDCVFMLLPMDPDLVNSSLGIFISIRKVAGGRHWKKKGGIILASFDGKIVMQVTERAEVLYAAGNVLGLAVPIPEEAE